MIDAYERRVFLTMLRYDGEAASSSIPFFGPNGWDWFLAERRFLARRLPKTCRCGHTCPGPFMEMHDCLPDSGEES